MAESCTISNREIATKISNNHSENYCVFNVLCVFISLVSILADLTTDIIVFAEYCKDGHFMWALGCFVFIFTPNVIVNVFSMRWYISDQSACLRNWISHGFLVGLVDRYIMFLHKIFVCKNWETFETQKLVSQRNDMCLLHFIYIFTGTIPQIILQFYAITVLDDNYQTKVFALTASIASVIWGCATYLYSITSFSNKKFNWNSLFLKCIWHFCMLISRIQSIILFTIVFDAWILLVMGLHWSAMTVWIITQNTKFCPNDFEETLYNVVMGFVYCFFYINLKEGHTKFKLLLYYTLIVAQNFGSLFLYVLLDTEHQKKLWSTATTICVIIGTVIGIGAMVLYYRFFHSSGPILWKNIHHDIELNNKSVIQNPNNTKNENPINHIRSFKNSKHSVQMDNNNASSDLQQEVDKKRNENADKKLLLDHWIARSGTPTFTSAPVGNISLDTSSIEIYTVENTPQPKEHQRQLVSKPMHCKINKKRTICAPTELTLKLSSLESIESSIDEITSSNLNLNKRRGICTTDELRAELNSLSLDVCNLLNEDFLKMIRAEHGSEISHDTDGSNKKTSSDSIDMDLDLSFSDINSSDINTFNENIVQKLCLSALKNIKVGNQDADIENIQRIALDILKEMYARKGRNKKQSILSKTRDIDTPTEVLSVHDYENMCAVNIAREAWGLRSWKGYTDIENWIHDGSVVQDRRRDTLTSGSSEVSSCVSQELKSAILSAPPFPKKSHTYSNVFVKFDRTDQDDYANTVISQDETFLAKPVMIDIGKDFSNLEPIIEELDDLGDVDPLNKKRLNSESSLVATIDEIRKCKVLTNSPRNLYHRRELKWNNQECHNTVSKVDSNLKNTLWKEPSKFDSSNILDCLHEKENSTDLKHQKLNKSEMNLNISECTSSKELYPTGNSERFCQTARRRQKTDSNNVRKNNSKSHEDILKTPEQNFEQLLWQLVSEDNGLNSIPNSLESFLKNEAPLPSVNANANKISNLKKNSRSRPRRKFSILRDRFEPRLNTNSDEEALFHSAESIINLHPSEGNVINVKNQLDEGRRSGCELYASSLQHDTLSSLDSIASRDVKDKKSHFMKPVLSPPKFNTKIRYKV